MKNGNTLQKTEPLDFSPLPPESPLPPDYSFFTSEFAKLSPDNRTMFRYFNIERPSTGRCILFFGGIHSCDPTNPLFKNTQRAWDLYRLIVPDRRKLLIVEGRAWDLDPDLPDDKLFSRDSGELGLIATLARRHKVPVISAEPDKGDINRFATQYGIYTVIDYLGLRSYPQYCRSTAVRPPLETFMSGVLNRWEAFTEGLAPGTDWSYRGFCQRFGQMFPGLDFSDFGKPSKLPLYEQFALRQTTHEYVLRTPASIISPLQRLTLHFNESRDNVLMSTIRKVSPDYDPLVVYGDVHLRALERSFTHEANQARSEPHSSYFPNHVYR